MGKAHYSPTLLRLFCLLRDALLATFLVLGKELLSGLPNVEIVSTLIIAYTVVYRARALVPIYLFVAIEAVLYPYPPTLLMYLYVWAILWGASMLLPGRRILPAPVYMLLCGLFGLSFGALCAPVQAIYFGLSFRGMLAWVAAGFPFDLVHAGGNLVMALLVPFISLLLLRLEGRVFSA